MECQACHTSLSDNAVFCHACGTKQPGACEAEGHDYAAFISYRRLPADRKAAIAVQRAIETYRLPKGVTATSAEDAAHPNAATHANARSLGKCFRDEDELAAGHSLPTHIAQALERSRCLVVICSPDTPESEWVQREIETFAQMHGRERIFAVLIGGSASESIPALLQSVAEAHPDGSVHTAHAAPLAADFRTSPHRPPRLEMLRILAAVAGCSLDDLRRRDTVRRRKRVLAWAAAGIALAALVIGFALHAGQAARETQVSESLRLAAESRQLLEQGDRYGAIEAALSALPAHGANRPQVAEAQEALEDALGVNPHPSTLWTAGYALNTEHSMSLLGSTLAHAKGEEATKASGIAVSAEGSFFAVSDDEGALTTYDLETGRLLARCEMPEGTKPLDGGLYARTLAAAGDYLIVSNSGQPGVLACFEGRTGRLAWQYDAAFPAIDASSAPGFATMVQPGARGGFSAALMDVAQGAPAAARDFESEGVLPANAGVHATMGKRYGDCFCAFGDTLASAKLDEDEARYAPLAFPIATSIGYDLIGGTKENSEGTSEGMLVVATASEEPADGVVRSYAIEAFDDDLNRLWKHEGTFTSEMMDDGTFVAYLSGEPTIWGFSLGGAGVIVSAGREALVLDARTGEPTFQRTYDQTIVSMMPASDEQSGSDTAFIACSNGIIAQKDLTGAGPDGEGDEERLALPFPVRWVQLAPQNESLVALSVPANDSGRIVAFRTDFTYGPETERSYSIEELVALADDALAAGGR